MELTMPRIHVIERLGYIWRLDNDEWESGFWRLTADRAGLLVNGQMFFHTKQKEPSHFGGVILGCRPATRDDAREEEHIGRIIFRIRASNEFKGVKAGSRGWAYEKKIVYR